MRFDIYLLITSLDKHFLNIVLEKYSTIDESSFDDLKKLKNQKTLYPSSICRDQHCISHVILTLNFVRLKSFVK